MSKSSEWSQRILRHERSGESVEKFCRAEGVSTASFYAWRRRLQPTFVEVTAAPSRRLVVRVGAAAIEVPQDFEAQHLRAVVEALR